MWSGHSPCSGSKRPGCQRPSGRGRSPVEAGTGRFGRRPLPITGDDTIDLLKQKRERESEQLNMISKLLKTRRSPKLSFANIAVSYVVFPALLIITLESTAISWAGEWAFLQHFKSKQ